MRTDHVFPWENYQAMDGVPRPLTLENLNFTLSTSLYLSTEDPAVEPRPDWYYSEYGRPDASGYSAGNITIICINKTESIEPGVVDVFYFLFYSFNDGQNVGGQTYGNHVSILISTAVLHKLTAQHLRSPISNIS